VPQFGTASPAIISLGTAKKKVARKSQRGTRGKNANAKPRRRGGVHVLKKKIRVGRNWGELCNEKKGNGGPVVWEGKERHFGR